MNEFANVYHINHSRNFSQIDNRIHHNLKLSYQARYLLVFLLQYNPDDKFKFSFEKISSASGIPFYKTRALVQELQDAGYIKLTRLRDGNRYGGYRWDIYEDPSISTESQDIPVSEPVVISKTEYNFNRLWESYPSHRRGDRKEALKAFNRIPEVNDNIENILKGLKELKGSNDWLKEQGKWIPGLKKFLDNRIWVEGLNNPTSIQGMIEKDLEVLKNAGY